MSIADTVTNTTKSLPGWSLSTLKSSNDAFLVATKKVVGTFEPIVKRLPKPPLADRLAELPQPPEVFKQWVTYVDKVVAEQKRFGLSLADTVSPVAPPAPAAPKASRAKAA